MAGDVRRYLIGRSIVAFMCVSSTQNEEDSRQLLAEHFELRTPCEVSCGDMKLVVYVSSVGTNIAITRRVHSQKTELSGWWAFRLNAITDLSSPADADDICAAMSAYNQKLPPKLPFKARTMSELAARVCDFFPVVIFNGKATEDGTDGIAGTIVSLNGNEMYVREMSTRHRWMADSICIDLDDVRYFIFGSGYENKLTEAAKWSDYF